MTVAALAWNNTSTNARQYVSHSRLTSVELIEYLVHQTGKLVKLSILSHQHHDSTLSVLTMPGSGSSFPRNDLTDGRRYALRGT
jgi:hypothetical protein